MRAGERPAAATESGNADSVERFRQLYDAHYDDLWRYCLRRSATPEAAEDVLSDTFAVAWRKLDDAPAGPRTRPWLFGIARNHLRNAWRKGRRRTELTARMASAEIPDDSDDPAILATDQSAQVLAALAKLKDDDQELLQLAAWEELPHREIAALLRCSENAVAIRLHRARARFETELTKSQLSLPQISNTTSSTTRQKDQPSNEQAVGNGADRQERKRP